jgi:hypothetical protein
MTAYLEYKNDNKIDKEIIIYQPTAAGTKNLLDTITASLQLSFSKEWLQQRVGAKKTEMPQIEPVETTNWIPKP